MIKRILRKNEGVAWLVITGATILIFGTICVFFLFSAHVRMSMYNLKDKVKLELNNTSAAASEMIYADLAEHNTQSYLNSFKQHENELRNSFLKRLRKDLYLETADYTVHPDTVKLTFEANGNAVTYIFECQADIKFQFMGESRTLVTQKIYITAKHYYKDTANGEGVTDYVNSPSNKNEHSLGG